MFAWIFTFINNYPWYDLAHYMESISQLLYVQQAEAVWEENILSCY